MSLGIYIQVPFCQTKCTYCNFHTGVVSRDRYQPYADAICREISSSELDDPPNVDTVYFGGGTPSLFDPATLAKILGTLHENFPFASTIPEITLEADPETITSEKAHAWLAAGFNRISLGSQSFNDAVLIASGRMHRRADILNAVKILRAAGFANISLDLIAGLPHQTRDTWEQSVAESLAIRPEHISIYMLEIDEGSRLGRESLAGGTRYSVATIPTDDATAEFYESAGAHLAAAGYDHYEISNWALPGRRSRHNLKYWRREPYLGLGAGAHSFDGHTRWANLHDSAAYVARIEQGATPREQIEPVTPAQALEEEFFLGLRQLDGIDFARIEREYAANGQRERVATIRDRIAALRQQGIIEFDAGGLRLSPSRLTVSNEVLVALLE
jgi:oxygen-independent coproporphyrinogen-3 oxidase